MAGFADGFGFIGSAISDLFGSSASASAAGGYKKAAALAGTEGKIAGYSGDTKLALEQRQAYQIIGGQQADVAGAGFTSGGSAGDLMRDSEMQAHMVAAAAKEQSSLQQLDFQSEQQTDLEKASEASSSSSGGLFGAIASGIGAIFSFGI